jgi:hypothetical protein
VMKPTHDLYDYSAPKVKVTCTYCRKVRPAGAYYVDEVDGKWFCNNHNRCANAYLRNGNRPKELTPKVKRPKKGGKSLYRR